jgi:hypothetical protein
VKIAEIAPEIVAEIVAPVEEDRWSEVKARKPVGPKQTPIAKQMDVKKRKLGRKTRSL